MTTLDIIRELTEGQSLKDGWVSYNCPFCQGRSRPILNVKIEVGYLIAHCFSTRCEMHGHRRFKINLSKGDLVNALEGKSTVVDTDLGEFDVGLSRIPTRFLQYLDQYHIGKELIDKYKIGYCEYNQEPWIEDRLIIPTEDGFLARSLDKAPKWKNFTCAPFVAKGYKSTLKALNVGTIGKILYITEDPLSCIRIGEYVDCMALLGTSVKPQYLSTIIDYDKVILWLDPDKAGYKAMLSQGSKLSSYVNVEYLVNDKEPKEMSNFELEEILNEKDIR